MSTTHDTTTRDATRQIDAVEVPRAGTWSVDPGHTSVEFVGRHFLLTKIRGRFVDVAGTVVIGEDPADSTIDVTVGMASVWSGSADRDAHLRSPDHFDVDRHPTATFRSNSVDWTGGSSATVHGQLTIMATTRDVDLDVTFRGGTADPWGNVRAVFSAALELDRTDWGLTWNMPLPGGRLLVSKQIRVEIETELVLDA